MLDRRFFAEGAALIAAAVLCATVSNAMAARERKLALVGDYPRALVVPARQPDAQPTEASEQATDPAPAVETSAPATTGTLTATFAPTPAPATTTHASAMQPHSPAAQQKPTAALAQTAPTATPKKSWPPHPDKAFVEISTDDAFQLYGEKALFIDARRTSNFADGHIAGSRSMPVWESDIDERVRALFNEVTNQQAPIVVYCSGGACEDSHMLADKLWGAGYENVLVFNDGFPAWEARGGAVAKGIPQ